MTTALRRRWPVRADRVVYTATNALSVAVRGNAKVLASEAGISERRARDWLAGDPGCVIARAFELIAGLGQSAGVIVAAARSILTQTLIRMSSADLSREFWRAMKAETEVQGRTDLRQMDAPRTLDDMRELQRMALEHAGQLERIAAICGECIDKEIVPERA